MKIYEDYAKLRKSLGKLQKSGKNDHFKSKHVELNSVLDVLDEHLEENNFICFVQIPITIEGKNYLRTELVHESGEKLSSELELITTRNDPQMLGSSLTYARRYSLITMLGLQAVDDDGNVGSGVTPTVTPPKPKTITDNKAKEIEELAKLKNSAISRILTAYKIEKLSELTAVQASAVMTRLGAM